MADAKAEVLRALGARPAPPAPGEEAAQARVAEAVTAWVAGLLGDGVRTTYGELCPMDGVDAAEVAATGADPVVRRFVSGGGIYRFGYDVYLRTCPRSSGARIDALGVLGRLADAVEHGGLPDAAGVSWAGHTLTRAPCLYAVDPHGNETYQMSAQATYLVPSE